MKIFDFFKKKDKQESKAIVPKSKSLSRIDHIIHDDIKDLIWFINGPKRNYNPEQHIQRSEFYVGDVRYTMDYSFSGSTEPSSIDTALVIRDFRDFSEVERLPYYPSYSGITPEQRGVYLKFLSNPYDPSFEVGYAFILYYGLERFLLTDKFDKAFDVLLKLRDVHENQSFQSYSGSALVLSCLYNKRPDMMIKFIGSIDKEFELTFSDNLFLLSAYSFEIPLYSKDIVRLAKTFEFSNKNYISKYPELFNETMTGIMKEKYNKDGLLLDEILNKREFNKLRTEEKSMFANISISDEKIRVPMIADSFKIKKVFNDLLEETHERVKKELAELRKKGSAPKVNQKSAPKEKKILVFDETEEKRLLSELRSNAKDPVRRHFSYIQLQDFYYKYRDVDSGYLDECIKYCEDDIETLDSLQNAYIASELKRIKEYSAFINKKEVETSIKQSERGFKGNIPAFNRLAIIYEKRKEYAKAIAICDMAIRYYGSWDMDASEFEDRKKRLLDKSK